MKNSLKSVLFLSVAVLSLGACSSDKGPGAIGSKNDIVVLNKGIAGAKMPEPFTADAANGPKIDGEDFSATVEQAEAAPVADVTEPEAVAAPVEELPQTADAIPEQQVQVAVPAESPEPQKTQETMEQSVVESPAPENTTTATQESIYPAEDYPKEEIQQAEQTQPAPEPTPAPIVAQPEPAAPLTAPTPSNVPYPLDPNAPYSPKAVAAAAAAAGTPVTTPALSPSGINLNDPAIIRSVQAALAAKTLYVGPQTGIMDANLMNSIVRYQTENKLAAGVLNEETLKHMGIIE